MADLNWVKIGEVCTIEKGSTGLAKALPGKYPLVATGAERKTARDYQFDAKAICIPLVSSTGHGKKTLNYVHYQEGKFALGSILAALIPKNEKVLNARYLHVYLQKNKNRVLVPLMKGAANVSLSMTAISNIEMPLPPIKNQEVILEKIDSISNEHAAFLSEANVQAGLFDKLRQTVLQEAVEGKLTAEWRKQNPKLISGEKNASKLLERIRSEKDRLIKEGKLKKDKALLPITDKETLFKLPVEWVWCRFGEMCRGIFTGPFGSMLHKSDYFLNGIPVVNPTHIVDGKIFSDGRMCVSEKTKERLKRYSLMCGDLVIARRGDLSKCAVVQSEQAGWLCGTGSFFIRGLNINQDYICLAYISQKAQAYLLQDSIGQTMDNLNQRLLRKLPIGLPPLAEQQAIVERVDRLMMIIDELEKQITERKDQSEILMQSVLREAFAR